MREALLKAVDDGVRAMESLRSPEALAFMERCAVTLADAMHFAEELTGFYREKRPALPAIALSEPGHLTCVGNDVGYTHVFSRAVEAYGQPGDVLVVLTTSGNSANLIPAVEVAKQRGLTTIAFLGKTGGKLKGAADLEWIVSGFQWSDRIQEAHMAAIHMIIEQVEQLLFANALV
jgi:D-sedoheptulose 7-phosphate isomerase